MKSMLSRLCLIILLVSSSLADAAPALRIINHYDRDLTIIVGRNANVLPDIPQPMILGMNSTIISRVLDTGEPAFVRTEAVDDAHHFAFFAVGVENNDTAIHGYMSEGVAFSWRHDELILCTPDFYREHHRSCFVA